MVHNNHEQDVHSDETFYYNTFNAYKVDEFKITMSIPQPP